jgi:hypothetical protein
MDERRSRVVEMRFFGGLSVEETASVRQVSVETVMRDWKFSRIVVAARTETRTVAKPSRASNPGRHTMTGIADGV